MAEEKWFLRDIYEFEKKDTLTSKTCIDISIRSELLNRGIPDDVIEEASRISSELGLNPRKGDKKKGLIFCCVYYAYKNLGKTETPKNVANLLNFPVKRIQSKLSKFNYKGGDDIVSFTDMIPRCCSDLKVSDEYLNDIKNFALKMKQSFDESYSTLNEKFPQDVAYCMIIFYLNIHGFVLDMDFIKEKTGLSTTSISLINKEISSSYNELK